MSISKTPIIILFLALIFFHIPSFSQQAYNNISADSTWFTWPEGKKMALSLTFDDARVSQTDIGIPLLDKYGIKATFYLNPPNMEKRLEKWKQAFKEGHEMGNHTMSHPCTGNFLWSRDNALENYTLNDIELEMIRANQAIEDMLGTAPVSFAYPCGQTFVGRGESAQSYIPVVAKIFLSGRGWLDEGPNDPGYCDLAQLTGMESDNKSFAQLKTLLDQAVKNGSWLVLAGHDIGDPGPQTTWSSTLDSLCQYVADPANGIWIAPAGTIAAYVKVRQGVKSKNK